MNRYPRTRAEKIFENWVVPALLGALLGALLCGCETEARLHRWFEQKNTQLEKGNLNDNR